MCKSETYPAVFTEFLILIKCCRKKNYEVIHLASSATSLRRSSAGRESVFCVTPKRPLPPAESEWNRTHPRWLVLMLRGGRERPLELLLMEVSPCLCERTIRAALTSMESRGECKTSCWII